MSGFIAQKGARSQNARSVPYEPVEVSKIRREQEKLSAEADAEFCAIFSDDVEHEKSFRVQEYKKKLMYRESEASTYGERLYIRSLLNFKFKKYRNVYYRMLCDKRASFNLVYEGEFQREFRQLENYSVKLLKSSDCIEEMKRILISMDAPKQVMPEGTESVLQTMMEKVREYTTLAMFNVLYEILRIILAEGSLNRALGIIGLLRYIPTNNEVFVMVRDLYVDLMTNVDELGAAPLTFKVSGLREVFSEGEQRMLPVKEVKTMRDELSRYNFAVSGTTNHPLAVEILDSLVANNTFHFSEDVLKDLLKLKRYHLSHGTLDPGLKDDLVGLAEALIDGSMGPNWLQCEPWELGRVVAKDYDDALKGYENGAITVEGPLQFLEKFQGIKVMNTFVVKKLSEIWTIFLTSHIFTNLNEGYKVVLENIHYHMGSLGSDFEFFTSFYDFVIGLFRNVLKFKESLNLMDLLGAPRDLALMQEINLLKEAIRDMQNGKKVLDFKETKEKAKKLRAECAALINTGKFQTLQSDFSWLRQCIDQLEAMVTNSRVQPYAISIQGPPGCGKTKIVESMASIVAYHSGATESTPNNVLSYDMDAKHQKFLGYPQVVLLNDFGSTKEEYVETTYVGLLQRLVDEAPFVVARASLAEKEESILYHNLVVVTTNEKATLSVKTCSVQKLNRRFNMAVVVSYTELCSRNAEQAGKSCDEYFRDHPTDDGLVRILTGKMHSSTTVINWEPVMGPRSRVFHSWAAFEIYFAKEYRAYTDDARARKNAYAALQRCCLGVTLPHPAGHRCACMDVQGVRDFWDDIKEWVVLEQMYMTRDVYIRMLEIYQGRYWDIVLLLSMVFLTISPWYFFPLIWVVYRLWNERFIRYDIPLWRLCSFLVLTAVIMGPMYGLLTLLTLLYCSTSLWKILGSWCFCYGDQVVEKVWRPTFTSGAWLLFGAMSAVVAGYGLTKMLMKTHDAVEAHGNIHGTPLNIPEEKSPVYKTDKVKLPRPTHWVPGDAKAIIHREHCFPIAATVISNQFIIAPRHYFIKKDGVAFNTRPLVEGEIVRGTHHGRDFSFIMSKGFYCELGENVDAILIAVYLAHVSTDLAWYQAAQDDRKGYYWNDQLADWSLPMQGVYTLGYTGVKTKPGDCGTPIYSRDGLFMGIHAGSALDRGCGYGTRILYSDFINTMKKVKIGKRTFHNPTPAIDSVKLPVLIEGEAPTGDMSWMPASFPVLGHRSLRGKPKMTGRKTEIFDVFSNFLPEEYGVPNVGHAKMNANGEYVSVITNRLNAMTKEGCLDFSIMEKAVALMPVTESQGERLGRLTLHQALVGDPENVFLSARDDTKAIGYELTSDGLTKKSVVEQRGDQYFCHPKFLEELDRVKGMLDKGPIMHLVTGVVKDEMLPLSKVDNGGGRLFFVCSLALNTHIQMAAGNVLTALLTDTVTHEIFAAVNAGSSAWKSIYNHVTVEGTRKWIYDADENKYDCRHGAAKLGYRLFMERQAENLGFNEEDLDYMNNVLLSSDYMIYNVCENYFVTRQGLPSGLKDTIHKNSVIKKMMFYYAVIKFCLKRNLAIPTTEWMRFQLRLAICGDDALFSHGAELDAMLPEGWYQLVAHESGYEMTPGNKIGKLVKAVAIEEVTFLKRKFKVEGARVFAPLDKKSIFKSLCYTTELAVPEKARNTNAVLCAQRELFLHGRADLDEFHKYVLRLNNEFGYSIPILTYDELLESFDSNSLETWAI